MVVGCVVVTVTVQGIYYCMNTSYLSYVFLLGKMKMQQKRSLFYFFYKISIVQTRFPTLHNFESTLSFLS